MATTVETLEQPDSQVELSVVDCDVHLVPRQLDEIVDRMPEPWRSRIGNRRAKASGKSVYKSMEAAKRLDSYPESGAPPGSEPDFVYKQLFGEAGVDIALVIPEVRYTVDPEINSAWCRAHNSWLADTWLENWNLDGRLFGSIAVSLDSPESAVSEVQYWAGHPKFKQILISDVTERPLGFPAFEPVWRVAAQHRLPVAMHFGGHGAGSLGMTPVGRFQHHVDYHSIAYPLTYSAHLVSLICSGVFDRHPDLSIVFVEGGFLWHRPLLARLARHWAAFSREIAAIGGDPLAYIRNNVRFTTQPVEESEEPRDVGRLMELADADRVLMFSSDYPHYDFDHPQRALPRSLSKESRARIMFRNASELYDLPKSRPAAPAFDQKVASSDS